MKLNSEIEKQIKQKLNSLKSKKIVGSQLMIGYYYDLLGYWKLDNGKLKPNETHIVNEIIDHTFKWRYKHCYLKYNDFNLSHPTISKTIKSLQEKKLLKVTNTRKKDGSLNKNKYELLFPEFMYEYLVFQKKKDEKNDIVEKVIQNKEKLIQMIKQNGGSIKIGNNENQEINKLYGKQLTNTKLIIENNEIVEEDQIPVF